MEQKEVELHIDKEKTVAHQQTALSKSDILHIIFNSQDTVSDVPFRPKGGSLYVVKANER